MRFSRAILLVFGWPLSMALGQDALLQPERFAVTPGAALGLEVKGAEGFAGTQATIPPERVASVRGQLAGAPLTLSELTAGPKTVRFSATFPRPGVAVIGLALKPVVTNLSADEVEVRLRDLHASEGLREAWTARPEPRQWREAGVQYLKAFVRVGEPSEGDRAWAEPLGQELELMPERDPTALHAGDELPVRVLRNGVPVPGFVVAFVSAGGTREHVVITDADGRASAVLNAQAVWLVYGTDLRRAQDPAHDWESDFTALVVETK